MAKGQWGGKRRRRRGDGPLMHVRLELPKDEHDLLKALAGYKETTIVGYVRGLVRREIARFRAGKEGRSIGSL